MVHYNSRVSEGVVVAEGPEPYEVTVSTARYGEITVHRDNVRLQEPVPLSVFLPEYSCLVTK